MESDAKKEYEAKKKERQEQKNVLSKKDRGGRTAKKVWGFLILVIILVLIFLGFRSIVKNNTPKGEDFSQSASIAGREHVAVGTIIPEGTYSSNPPSSGPHYPNTAQTGFYDIDEAVEDQFIIHNLEHGDIWIAYHPRVSETTKDLIRGFAGRFVVVSPRENNESDISLVSWGKIDSFNENDLTEERIKDFILRYDDKGPEKVRGGGGHQATSI